MNNSLHLALFDGEMFTGDNTPAVTITIRLDCVESFAQVPYSRTVVRMLSGENLTLQVPYDEFRTIYMQAFMPAGEF